ncbi:MAG TPA: alpha/beta family hydrolase [Ornithinimicrobium sp.]|nr:alpha/beta family hydrolase [Ornithinimicrobium sp.]
MTGAGPAVLVPTEQGPGRVRVAAADAPRGTLLLGHGAGGQRDSRDLLALTSLADHGWSVVLVDQPWRVAGRRVATAPPRLDAAWRQILAALAAEQSGARGAPLPRPWVVGGRSAGARVACRTSVGTDGSAPVVAGVVCLAFPLHPPGRPERSRADELALPVRAGLPTLVVQGRNDPFGGPDELGEAVGDHRLTVVPVSGTHSPTADLTALTGAVRRLLDDLATADPEDTSP